MHNCFAIIIALIFSAMSCSGQSFVAKYPKLTSKNLPEFFEDWSAYSDSVAHGADCKSDICNAINAEFDSHFRTIRFLQGDASHYVKKSKRKDYGIIPQYIPVEYYPIELAPNDTLFFSWDYASLHNDILVTDTITPVLRQNELYLTTKISNRLMEFITGLNVENERPYRFIRKNIEKLRRYIDHYNEDHNGGVIFSNYPYIWKVQATKNLIVLHIRDSNYSGYEQWYIIKGNELRKVPGERNAWVE